MEKDRGKSLTIMIIIVFGWYLFYVIGLFVVLTQTGLGALFNLASIVGIARIILGLIGLFGLWQMKKWGVYLFGLAFAIEILMGLIDFISTNSGSFDILDIRPSINFAFIAEILLAWAIFGKRKSFN